MPIDRSAFITPQPLSNVAFDYYLDEKSFIAKQVCTILPIEKGTTKVTSIDGSKLRPPDDERGTDSEPALMDEQLFESTINLTEYKEGSEINPRKVRDADVPALLDEGRKVKVLTQRLMLKQEIRAADLILTSGNYATANTSALTSGVKWNEAGGAPEADKLTVNEAMLDGCGRKPNALILEALTLGKLKLSPEWRARTQYTNGGPIPTELIKAFFEVDYLFIGSARYDNALQGTSSRSMTKVWGDDAVFFHYDPSTSLESQNPFMIYMVNNGFWTDVLVDPKRKGAAGNMKRVTVGTEYGFAKGMVESSTSSKFVSAYLLRDVVA